MRTRNFSVATLAWASLCALACMLCTQPAAAQGSLVTIGVTADKGSFLDVCGHPASALPADVLDCSVTDSVAIYDAHTFKVG